MADKKLTWEDLTKELLHDLALTGNSHVEADGEGVRRVSALEKLTRDRHRDRLRDYNREASRRRPGRTTPFRERLKAFCCRLVVEMDIIGLSLHKEFGDLFPEVKPNT